jgi:hypothetical protein
LNLMLPGLFCQWVGYLAAFVDCAATRPSEGRQMPP